MDTRSVSEMKKLIADALETDRREVVQQMKAMQDQIQELIISQSKRVEDEVHSGGTSGSGTGGNKEHSGWHPNDIKVGIPEYEGKLDPDEFVEWIQTVERMFDYKQTAEDEKAYIDFEIAEAEFERTRQLYERLLDRTKHLKVWISYAKFEASAMEETEEQEDLPEDVLNEQRKLCIERAWRVFENAINYYRISAPELKEERAMLLEEWLNMESSFGDLGDTELVRVKLPKKLKKKRQLEMDDGPSGYEEYIDYIFPEESEASNLKFLEQAYKWKQQKKQKVSEKMRIQISHT